MAVFFNLKKAYDQAWQHGIMEDLHAICLHGQLPQGSILTVILFRVKVNSIATAIKRVVSCSLFVDDFILYYSGANMNVIERQLQLSINGIHQWSVLIFQDQNSLHVLLPAA